MRRFTNLGEKAHYKVAPDFEYITGTLATVGYSDPLEVGPGPSFYAWDGNWVGTITMEFSIDDGATWWGYGRTFPSHHVGGDVWKQTWADCGGEEGIRLLFRLGFDAGNYTSGTCNWLIGQGM